MVCHNVSITSEDANIFKEKNLQITNEKCVVFYGGDVGIVNYDFFKQFPNTKKMSFQNVKLSLKSSESVGEHRNMKLVGFLSSDIKGNQETNALHSLVNLRKFVMTDCLLENTTVDKMLLEKNINLVDVTLNDGGVHPPKDESLPILAQINEDVFENMPNLEQVYMIVHKMSIFPPKLLKGKNKLKSAEIDGRFIEFPANLPDFIEDLSISFHKITAINKSNFQNFKNLKSLTMYYSDLEHIDENTFEDLEHLKFLNINNNKLKEFSSKYLKNNRQLKFVVLVNNPFTSPVDLSDLGLNDDEKSGYFTKPDYEFDGE